MKISNFLCSRVLRSYLLGVVLVLAVLELRWYITPDPYRPGLLLLAAVTISTWYGGFWPGLVSLILAAIVEAWVLPPVNSFRVSSREDIQRLILFVLMALLITTLYTARRRAERKLLQTERRVNFALAAARIGCWEVDIQSGTFWSSPNLAEIYGHPPERFARTYEGFFAYIHPEDRDFVRLATIKRGSEATFYEIVHRVIDASGGMRWVNTRGRIFTDASDKVERMVGAVYLLDSPPGERAPRELPGAEAGNVLVADAVPHD